MTVNQIPKHTQVLVIGGGPAGSTAASFLVQEGIEVVICERDKFPRYHIGETLITSVLPILEFIGLREEIDNYGFIVKNGAHWKLKKELPNAHTDFRKSPKYKYSYNVIRSEFDELLLNFSEKKGTKVFQETTIKDIIFEGDKPVSANWVRADKTEGNITFDYLIDASGLAGLLSNRYLKNRKQQPALANIALAGYWENFKHYVDEKGEEFPGEFFMAAIEDGSGWIWAIPLHDGTLSVGVVLREAIFKKLQNENLTMEQIYNSKIKLSFGIQDLIPNAKPVGEIKYWNDFSYYAEEFGGDNFRLIGDAAAFLDPLLSSGLHIASIGALSAAATLCAVIKGDCDPQIAAKFHDTYVRASYTRFLFLVTALYEQITNQEAVVLEGVTDNNLQSVFDIIQPVLTGNFDINKDQPIPEMKSEKVVSYLKNWFNKSIASSEKPHLAVFAAEDFAVDASKAINGYYIRFEKGRLGLQKVEV